MTSEPRLARGDLLPRIVTSPPGPRSRGLSEEIGRREAPGINTLVGGAPSLFWHQALGANVLDVDGNRYIDLTAGFGVAAVGHRHPRVVRALRTQSGRLLHGLGDAHPHDLRPALATRLASLAPVHRDHPTPDEVRAYFAISGADAVEIAWKTATLATQRAGVVVFRPAYHGLTLGALAFASREAFRAPFATALHPLVHRLDYGCDPAALERTLDSHPDIGCVLFEPVVGREGVIFPPAGWLQQIERCSRRHGVLTIADEVFTGFGRTGRWFAVETEGVEPDLLVCGKALGGGLPIAAVLGRRQLLDAWTTTGEALHTATFVAHPLACATALATLDTLEQEELPRRASRLGEWIGRRTSSWTDRFAALAAVRGRGLLWALELTSKSAASDLVDDLLARGVLALAGGASGRVLQIVPPLTITERQLACALDLLEQCLTAAGER